MPTEITGSCLCGKVAFSCCDDFQQFHQCFCQQCQKSTGSAHAANLFTAPDNIVWLRGQEAVKRYDVPGRTISRAFCCECGGAVPYLSGSGRSLVVPAGSLDQLPELGVQDNIFWAERPSWYDDALTAVHFDAFPE